MEARTSATEAIYVDARDAWKVPQYIFNTEGVDVGQGRDVGDHTIDFVNKIHGVDVGQMNRRQLTSQKSSYCVKIATEF